MSIGDPITDPVAVPSGGNIYIQDTEPSAPNPNDLWVDTSAGEVGIGGIKIWTGTQWDLAVNFLSLFDTPASYIGEGTRAVVVKASEDGIEFSTVSAGGGHVIQDEGVSLANRAYLNFVGDGIEATDNAGNNATDVTISGIGDAVKIHGQDIDVTGLSDNQLLIYKSGSSSWLLTDQATLVVTDLAFANRTATSFDITSSTGSDATVTGATGTLAGALTAADWQTIQDLPTTYLGIGHGSDTGNPHSTSFSNLTGSARDNADLTAELDLKLDISGNGSQLTGLTAAQVGLDQVDNTSDLDKPISTATQTALDLKLEALADDLAPELGGELRTKGWDIVLSDSSDQEHGGIAHVEDKEFGLPEGVGMGRSSGEGYTPYNGGIHFGDAVTNVLGSAVFLHALKQEGLIEWKNVAVNPGTGQLVSVDFPDPGQQASPYPATDATDTDLGSGTTEGPWTELTNLAVTFGNDVDAGDIFEADVNLNVLGTSGTGFLHVGFGIGGVAPSGDGQKFLITEGYDGWLSVALRITADQQYSAGTTFSVFVKRGASQGSGFTGNWDLKHSTGTPGAKECYAYTSGEHRFNYDDHPDETDREADLRGVQIGWTFSYTGYSSTVTGIDARGSHIRYTMADSGRGSEGVRTFTFGPIFGLILNGSEVGQAHEFFLAIAGAGGGGAPQIREPWRGTLSAQGQPIGSDGLYHPVAHDGTVSKIEFSCDANDFPSGTASTVMVRRVLRSDGSKIDLLTANASLLGTSLVAGSLGATLTVQASLHDIEVEVMQDGGEGGGFGIAVFY